jgi:ABC-type uncharacterized transport system auxiliary subunit
MRAIWICMIAVALAGCGGGGRIPATKYYKLDIPPAPAPAVPSAPASLRIEPFRATALLRQDKIVYRPSPVEVGFYEYHRWAEPPNDAVTKALADQLVKRRVFQSVEISQGTDKVDYVLRGTIDRLQEVDYMGAVRVQVSISVELEDPAQQQTVWSGAASSECVVTKGNVQGVVAAMGQASQQSIARLMTDVTKFVQVHQHASMAPAAASQH